MFFFVFEYICFKTCLDVVLYKSRVIEGFARSSTVDKWEVYQRTHIKHKIFQDKKTKIKWKSLDGETNEIKTKKHMISKEGSLEKKIGKY